MLYHQGEKIEEYAYLPNSKGMIMLSENVLKDPRLKISERVRNWGLEVARRQLEIYHEISNGGVR